MKTELEISNLKDFPSRVAYKGEIYTIKFDKIIERNYGDEYVKVTHHFLPYISESGNEMNFDEKGIAHKYPGVTTDGRTKFGKIVASWRKKYNSKSSDVIGEIL